MDDLLVRGGTVCDGSGAPRYTADVAIRDGRVRAIGRDTGPARRTLDADGLVVAPGFIDVHTHYDCQVSWDPWLTPSVWHGVTTVVMGNCGFAIAPARPEHREQLMKTLVNVEGMSFEALSAGIRWEWGSFGEYLDFVERCRPALNVAALLGHSALRLHVLGEEATERAARPDEVARMQALAAAALAAGAIGISSSTFEGHNGAGGLPVPSRLAAPDEFAALFTALGAAHRGIFEVTIGSQGLDLAQLSALSADSGRPVALVSLEFFYRDEAPTRHVQALDEVRALQQRGGRITPEVACRPILMQFPMREPFMFGDLPTMTAIMGRAPEERLAAFRDPAFRAGLRADIVAPQRHLFNGQWDRLTVGLVQRPENTRWIGKSLAEVAAAQGQDPVDTLCELTVAENLDLALTIPLLNHEDRAVRELITHPAGLVALSDAGAHLSLLCDASYATTLLGKWTRREGAFTLEEAVRRLTAHPAAVFGIPERGQLAPGWAADLAIFDPATVDSLPVEPVNDLPGGERRLISRAAGVHYTIVNGHVLPPPAAMDPAQVPGSGQVLRQFVG